MCQKRLKEQHHHLSLAYCLGKQRSIPLSWMIMFPYFPYQHGQIPLRPLFGSSKCRLIDVPGHQRYITNMIAGASLADAALLLVPAVDTFAWSLCSAGGGVPEGARRGMIGTVDS